MRTPAATLLRTANAVARLGSSPAAFVTLPKQDLLDALHAIADLRQACDTFSAWIAGELNRRSSTDLGSAGLAQQEGYRTPQAMVEAITGTTRGGAVSIVEVGKMLAETDAVETLQREHPELPAPPTPWQAPIAHAVTDGRVSIAQADAIRAGLGLPTDAVPAEALSEAARELLEDAATLTAAQLHRRARQLRDDLGDTEVADREKAQLEQQHLKAWKRPDGMVEGKFLYAPEPGAFLLSVLDELTNPRRGGPRFVKEEDRARIDAIVNDPRPTERLAADGFLELLRIGADADPGQVYGSRRPAVRVIVTKESLDSGDGHGSIQDTGEAVSIGTIRREVCSTGTVAVVLDDDGQCVNVGREQRLFTARQRIGLAVRDGGCMWPGCDRPPSWCEAHHINQWKRDHGKTDIADGILLCKHHHLLLHNNGWDIRRTGGQYLLLPPRSISPTREARHLATKSRAVQDWNARRHRLRPRDSVPPSGPASPKD
ncbi:HNH endonuclease signature motif containing protein [Planctomonas deserti]|uniref:HNH endonuclease signature motif containing protein n=1 Tax=Planctomonas deserti TaxID=2144185 RepID=UPI00131EF216|nr:HNH endonuclease signature motif containing protein [Planctomonas deserti]